MSGPEVEPHAIDDPLTTSGAIGTPDGVLVTSYAGCHAAFRDSALVPGVREMSRRMGLDVGLGGVTERFLLWTDGAEHSHLRRIVAPWFTPARVERLRNDVECFVASLLHRFEENDARDFMAPVANRIPGAVFCWMVGAPVAWSDNLFNLSERLLKVFTGDDAFAASITDAASELATLVFELIEMKLSEPGDDLMSMMLARIDNDAFTLTDAGSMVFEMLAASTDNTAHSIGAAVHQFATHPDQFALLRDDPQLTGSAVEECGRCEPRVRVDTRHAISATRLCGVDVPEGSLVTVSILDANHDPAVFPNPERLDITRDPALPHLGFGLGRHHCLGASLARMEIGVVLHQLATRWTDLAPAGDAVIERSNNTMVSYLPISVN